MKTFLQTCIGILICDLWFNEEQPGFLLVLIRNVVSNPRLTKGQWCVLLKWVNLMTEGLTVNMTHSQEQVSCLQSIIKHESS